MQLNRSFLHSMARFNARGTLKRMATLQQPLSKFHNSQREKTTIQQQQYIFSFLQQSVQTFLERCRGRRRSGPPSLRWRNAPTGNWRLLLASHNIAQAGEFIAQAHVGFVKRFRSLAMRLDLVTVFLAHLTNIRRIITIIMWIQIHKRTSESVLKRTLKIS